MLQEITRDFTMIRHNLTDREQWLEKRIQGIGGSDASAIMGANPWKNSEELWEEKVGLKQSPVISNNKAVDYGNDAENPLRKLFEFDFPQYDVFHDEFQICQSEKYPFMLASFDGELVDKETGEMGILEIKTTSILQSMQKEKWNDRIPDNYYCQIIHYLIVSGYSFAILKAQLKFEYDGLPFLTTKHYRFNASDLQDDMNLLIEHETKFWVHVTERTRPNLVLPRI